MTRYSIPILLICFKRYDKTLEVFNSIKTIKPSKLYVSIDGARTDSERIEVDKVASIFENGVDWKCDLRINRSNVNQGCKYGVYNAITWFFKNEEMGIILEDDIVPYKQFYSYCKELLEKYKDNKKIACISGWSYFYNKEPDNYPYTYYFSHIQSSWGWATWKDRWELIDLELKDFDFKDVEKKLINDGLAVQIVNFYKFIYNKKWCFDTTWDYQFLLSVLMKNDMYCIQPIKRLVKNIGDTDGTHPTTENLNKSEAVNDNFEMKHPPTIEYDPELDLLRNYQTHEYVGEIILNKKIKNMNILFDSQIYDLQQFGGISRMYVDIHNEWNKDNEISSKFSVFATKNIYLSKTKPYGNANNRSWSIKMIEEGNYDIFYPTFFSPYFLKHLKGKPFIMSVHDMIPELYPQFFKKNDPQILGKREMVKYASAIEVPTETTKNDLIRILNVNPSKIHVVGRGIDKDFGSKVLDKSIIDGKYVLYVGQRNAYKRFDWFIKHSASFFKKHPRIKLVCTGNDFNTKEQELLKEYKMDKKAIVIKPDDVELATLYKNALFFVYTSEYEGFGIPILEAYKMGCIALLNNNKCFNEVTFGNGTFFDLKEDESNIADIMEETLKLTPKEKEAVLKTQYEIFFNYSIEKTASKIKNIIQQVLSAKKQNLDIFICTHKKFSSLVGDKVYKVIDASRINNDTAENGLGGSFYSELMSYKYVLKNWKIKDYIGFCSYRKYFEFLDRIPDIDKLFSDYDCIVSKPIIFAQSVKQQYSILHNIEDLYIVGGIIADKFPSYVNSWHNFINSNIFIPYNMFIMKREDFKRYIDFVFGVLDEYVKIVGTDIVKRIENNKDKYLKDFYPNNTVEYQYRIGGYIAERLTNVFLMNNFKKMKTYPIIITEDKYNKEKKE